MFFFFMSLTVLFFSGVLVELLAKGLCGLTGVYYVSAACILLVLLAYPIFPPQLRLKKCFCLGCFNFLLH